MKTKILVTVVLTTFLTAILYAQSKTTFGIRAGVNFQNLNGKDSDGDKLNYDLKTGFNAGVNAEIPVGIDFFVQPGLVFSAKGAKYEIANVEIKRNLSYLEIPVNFLYKPELGEGRILLGFGPYAAIAVGGNVKGGNANIDIEFGNDVGENKRFDAGANLLAGYEFNNKISFQLNAGLGLVSMYNRPDNDNKSSMKNTGFGVSVGYRFQ
jgi:Outer membrane protein beta-barrel domain